MNNKISIYYPLAVSLPVDTEREFAQNLSHIERAPLAEEDKMQYDKRTLFYDVFLSADKKILICVGPPFVNIGPPLAVKYKGKNLKFTLPSSDLRNVNNKCVVIYVSLNNIQWHRTLSVTMEFADFQIDISCPPSANPLDKKEYLMLMTMQKDNPLIWIKDWCRWYSRVHGVRRIILYDNGSSKEYSIKDLSKELSGLDVQILLIHWPFPFGPLSSSYNQFTQTGALNHCRLFFGIYNQWCINIDIDEYLYLSSPLSLYEYLQHRAYLPVVYLNSYFALHKKTIKDQLIRCFDFIYRYRQLRNVHLKYIYQPEQILVNKVHRVEIKLKLKYGFVKLWIKISNRNSSEREKEMKEKPQLFFYHLFTLHTGWKSGNRSWSTSTYRLTKFVKDEQLRNKMKEIGMLADHIEKKC